MLTKWHATFQLATGDRHPDGPRRQWELPGSLWLEYLCICSSDASDASATRSWGVGRSRTHRTRRCRLVLMESLVTNAALVQPDRPRQSPGILPKLAAAHVRFLCGVAPCRRRSVPFLPGSMTTGPVVHHRGTVGDTVDVFEVPGVRRRGVGVPVTPTGTDLVLEEHVGPLGLSAWRPALREIQVSFRDGPARRTVTPSYYFVCGAKGSLCCNRTLN
jgi:hypothetical protein